MTALLHRGAALVAVTCAVLSVVLIQRAGAWDLGPAPQVAVDAGVGLSYPVIALLVLTAPDLRPGTRTLARVLLVSGVASGAAALGTAWALVATESTALVRAVVQLQSWLWVPGFLPLLTLVPLLYPSGLLRGRPWRLAAAASVAGIVLLSVGVALYPERFVGTVSHTKPVTALLPAQVLSVCAAVLLVPAAIAGLVSLVIRLRSARGLERRQVAVLLTAAAVLVVVTAVQGPVPAPWDVLAQSAAVVLVPIAIGVAVTRHGLYELDVAVRRTAVVASLTVCLAGLYVSLVAVVGGVLDPGSEVSAALAAGLTGAAIQPLARRLTAGVDRIYYGDRADPFAVLARLGSELAVAPADMESAPQLVCRTVIGSLRLPGAELRLATVSGPSVAARAGELDKARETPVPLQHRGTTVGWLVVSPRSGEAELDARDHDVLTAVAAQAAPAVAALLLRRQLQRSRESLVSAREAERRHLRRELHDGVGA
ncbi:MAG TPA: hypothetical protein VFI19_06975, partial [Nocardioides sp.]|nr:hypothetical protein [Nocardioides sp.]